MIIVKEILTSRVIKSHEEADYSSLESKLTFPTF